jgi:hypothetical protein
MPRNNLQILFNELEREAEQAESVFLLADKNRHTLKAAYASLLSTLNGVQGKLGRYPQAAALKRIKLIETLLKDLLLRHETERRHFNALGFLLSRLRTNLATEILEPRLYGKIRTALENETNLVRLREKFPDAESVITAPALPVKKTRQTHQAASSGRGRPALCHTRAETGEKNGARAHCRKIAESGLYILIFTYGRCFLGRPETLCGLP